MVATLPTAAPLLERDAADLDLLQGAWVTVAGPKAATLLVAGTRYAFEFLGGDIHIGSFVLNPFDAPRHIDMRIEEGPPHHRGLTAYCIYQLDHGALRWCPSRPGSANRLFHFPGVDDPRHLSLVFRPSHPRKGA